KRIENSAPHAIVEAGLIHVPEGKKVFSFMSVYENLLMGGYIKEAREKISERMEYVFQIFPVLKEKKDQLAGTLSGGERQMLTIGMGLMACPKLLTLDEPLQGLSPLYAVKTLDAIKDLNERDKLTILLVEQNVDYALKYAQRGYVIENGRVTLSGTCTELRDNEHVKKAYLGI
ncbi:MAG: ABC transporter ATP-binding protein, partial [Fervidobacterium sp.]